MKGSAASVKITNPDKVMYPAAGFTKSDFVGYYLAVSRYILPHLRNRPVTLKRYPDGVDGEFFYEKNAPAFTPAWVKTFPVPRRQGGPAIRYILINDRRTLAWCANMASLELHPFLHRVPALESPTAIVFDFDPGEGTDVLTCARVAFLVKDVLDRLRLASLVKVSGSKGLQLYVPLNSRAAYAQTQPFARAMAELLAREHPDLVTAAMAKSERGGRVFIDWSQNAPHKTTVAVYSLRAKRPRPFVSMPVTWDELRAAMERRDAKALDFEPAAALERLAKIGDLFRPVLTRRQRLPSRFLAEVGAAPPRGKPAPRTLETYRAKRNFSRTPEPAPRPVRRSSQGSRRRFVIQKHAASRLHYDFRLEMNDVLKSWAVPKGLPYALAERRLAMATEDHPLDYLEFEGTIPRGQYGGGTVMVWDIGTYEVIDGSYQAGKLRVFLEGRKLRGEWTLVRTGDGDGRKWLIIKTGSAHDAVSPRRDDASALTRRTMARIAEDNDAQWESNRDRPAGATPCPFANLPEPKSARRGMALTGEATTQCRWLKPELVAEVAFADWTGKNHLRHARFVALRDDRDPREVVREAA